MKKICLLSCLLICSTALNAQWHQTTGPVCGGNIKDILIDGQDVIVATGGGMFKSTNTGASWQPINSGLVNPVVWALAKKGNTLFAGTDVATLPSGVYASVNGGNSWNLKNIGLTYPSVTSFAIDGNYLYAGTWGGGVSSSTNDAQSWIAANNGLPANSMMLAFAANNGTVLCSTYWDGVYRTTNNGVSWIPAAVSTATGPQSPKVQCFVTLGSTIFAGASGGGYIYKSLDNGATWSQSNSGINSWVYALEASGSILYAGTNSGFFTSTDNGATWVANTALQTGLYVTAIAASGNTIYAGTDKGVFLSLNGGTSWTLTSYGIANVDTKCVFPFGNSILAGTYYNLGSFETANGGVNWNPLGTGLTDDVNVFAANGNSLYAGTSTQGIYLSTNSGSTWTNINNNLVGPMQTRINDIAFLNNRVFIATQGGGILSSVNSGSWTPAASGLPTPYVSALTVKGNTIFAGTANDLFKSINNGANWTACPLPNTPPSWVYTLKVNGNKIYAGCLDNDALLSTDDGLTWTSIKNSGLPVRINSFAFVGDTVFAATWGQGVFTSTNSGTSWTTFNTGLSEHHVNALTVSGGYLYAGTANEGGVWRNLLPNGVSNPVDIKENRRDKLAFEVYPNPFSASATLVFDRRLSNASIFIVDHIGRTVGEERFSGTTLEIQRGKLAQGIYFICVMEQGQATARKKVIID